MSALAPAMQAYFTDRLIAQRDASPNTIAAYCQTFRLLLQFIAKRTGTKPSELDIDQLDAPLIAAFLNHLEKARGNSVCTRHNRLAAIHSLFAYMALHHPEHAAGAVAWFERSGLLLWPGEAIAQDLGLWMGAVAGWVFAGACG